MKVNYLFSGIDKSIGFNKLQASYLKENIKNKQNIVFIASIFDNYERNDIQHKTILSWFKNININFNNSYVIDNRTNKLESKNILQNADIVYLMGGSPELQMKSINEYELKEYIRTVNIVIGVSAGSMNQSKRVVYKDEYQDYKIFDYEGLDLIDINIYPHFDMNNEELLKENIEISNIIPILSLPNDSFIMVKNGEKEFIGTYYKIKNGIIDEKNEKGKQL